ncbi:T-cell activation Rho GTPase-activating protein isoform X1 [Bos indicus x Bos taurus]|uniref:T-cell activation Rho GTPase-activating protein n=2 Tax=Bos indicus x Bos taurus TaxID=30522 RepID=A0A4W2FZZ6_BOBOX|nr:T-cell activation Rho GTPase-activating protein isoform X1 [Bos indicus x Bos taurus]
MPGPQAPRAPPGKSRDGVPAAKSMLGSLTQRRPSVPATGLGKVFSKAWLPARKGLASAVSLQQLDLPTQQTESILQCPVVLTQGPRTKERHLFLFRDWLVVAKQRSSTSYRFEQKLPLSELGVVSCDSEEEVDKDEAGRLTPRGGNTIFFTMASKPCVTEFPSREVKEVWLEALRGQSQGHTGAKFITGPSARTPMKLTSSCHASKTLNACDMETLIECQSEGNIKEHPLLASCESEDNICQLIEIKKRKKVSNWLLLMRRLSSSSDVSAASEPELKTSLFDQPLSAICSDNTLPGPIQDILTILCLKGPSTEGIFRKAANEKARKELKEELSSGGVVDLRSLPVHLLAVVLKDFLRSIPLKLLSCDLFEEWMGALAKQSEEDRIEALKQVADKLPRPNHLLLKHLVSVLHVISKNSEVNRMDASNLAICIGPNVLSPENEHNLSLEARRDLNDKVKTLVEFLIDNCFEIFGEDFPAHSRIASDDSLEHTDSSDMSTLQNDSAYDSNDPDHDVEPAGSPSSQPPGPPELAAGGVEPRAPLRPWEPVVNTTARLKGFLGQPDRRYSDPSTTFSPECLEGRRANPKLTRSEDDFTAVAQAASRFAGEEAEDPFPEEVFPAAEGRAQRPRDLGEWSPTQGSVSPCARVPKAPSSGSLDAFSDSSPLASPSSPKRNFFTRHQSFTKAEKSKPNREIKKHSMSFSFTSHQRGLTKMRSFGATKSKGCPRDQEKRGSKKESQLAGRIVQESSSDAPGQAVLGFNSGAYALSVEDVFRLVDQRHPGRPPSYEEAVRLQALELAPRGGQTVGSLRARVLSLDAGLLPPLPAHPHGDSRNIRGPEPLDGLRGGLGTETWRQSCAPKDAAGRVMVPGTSELQRLRTASESQQKGRQAVLARRCSQPVFDAEQLRFAKESYI